MNVGIIDNCNCSEIDHLANELVEWLVQKGHKIWNGASGDGLAKKLSKWPPCC